MRGESEQAAGDGGLRIPAVVGPTAVGKTAAAVLLAEGRGWEIISADSRQVFRRLDIGTAKPTPDDKARVTHHLIDVVEPWEVYSCGSFRRDALAAVREVAGRGRSPLLVGGSGLYIRALEKGLFDGPARDDNIRAKLRRFADEGGREGLHRRLSAVDPEAASRIHPRNVERVIRALEVFEATGSRISDLQRRSTVVGPFRLFKVGLRRGRDSLYRLIARRFDAMMEAGFYEEVSGLLASGFSESWPSFRTVGYREMAACVAGRLTVDEAREKAKTATRQFAKRQLTWFAKADVDVWLDVEDDEPPAETCERINSILMAAGFA